MSDKDFLSQFSDENKKPESFKEEERIKIVKEKRPLNKGVIIGLPAVCIILGILVYFLFFAPKIEMPDFLYKTKSDVSAWVKQQGIATQGILFEQEYNFDYEEGTILSQSVEAGKKVKEDVKITFVESLGADPDERISVPDLKEMDKAEIQEWIDQNKLTKTKISTSYSDSVEADQVISYSFSGCEEDSFTRSSTLKISISKGVQPAGTISVENFLDKSVEYVRTWAKEKKVVLNEYESFSDDVEEGMIVSQSVSANKTIKEGESLTVSVSKGKGIVVPDLTKMDKEAADAWIKENAVVVKERYSLSENHIVSQSICAGSVVSAKDLIEMEVVENLGSDFYLHEFTEGSSIAGVMTYDQLVDLCNEKRSSGIDAYCGNWNDSNEEYSYLYRKGTIVSVRYFSYSTGKEYQEADKMPLDLRFEVVLSKGKITEIDVSELYDSGCYDKMRLMDLLTENGIPFVNECEKDNCKISFTGNSSADNKTLTYYEGDTLTLKDWE